MGASFYWEPIRGTILDVGARSRFKEALEKVFGPGDHWELRQEDISLLRGMAAAGLEEKAFEELISALEKHGHVRLTARY